MFVSAAGGGDGARFAALTGTDGSDGFAAGMAAAIAARDDGPTRRGPGAGSAAAAAATAARVAARAAAIAATVAAPPTSAHAAM